MKLIILSIFIFLIGCEHYNCNPLFRDYKYNQKVIVIGGFFQGQTGRILEKTWIYNNDKCNDPAFGIIFDSTKEKYSVSQYFLEISK